ncbi:integrin beta-6 [Pieris rapae]|uniref:integrin beta-6 n=1 Tax=Pieris rapae TaxID=64459 RepID=UPI000B9271AB|nr:integrin beta-6 [Pieris rapae]
MAVVWFAVLLLFTCREVFASYRDCSNIVEIRSCDECIRCGGHWCNDPYEFTRCHLDLADNWCQGMKESIPTDNDMAVSGQFFDPKYAVNSVRSGREHNLAIKYRSSESDPKVEYVVNSTQGSDVFVTKTTSCKDGSCTTTLDVSPETNFCSIKGSTHEYFNVKLNIQNVSEEAVMKFHVPCACACSSKVELMSPKCNGRGSLSCGVCTCDSGWSGTFCETPICEKKRGDVPCTDSARSDVECSGNGVCGPCDECVCFTDRLGSQYFEKDNFCADICMATNDCDDCFHNPMPGRCDFCHFPLIKQNLNQSLLEQKDEFNRNVWITCNDTLDGCHFEYVAMKANEETYYMVTKSCDPVEEKQVTGGVNVTLPIVLGIIAVVAAVAATAGYLVWKNRPPALPLNDPMYQNIGAEDCTGENPLYKPPTSSFKNPTYGKW